LDQLEKARGLYSEGTEFFNAGQYQDAELKFREAQSLSPDRISVLISLSAALLKQGKFVDAKLACNSALALNAGASEALFNLGLIYSLEGNFAEAIGQFEKAIQLDPGFPDSWHYRGYSLNGLGRHAEALASYEKALNLQALRPDSLLGVAEVLFDMNLFNLSLVFIERALQLNPRSAEAHLQKAQLHHRRNETAEAIASFSAALEYNHPNPDLIKFSLAALRGIPYEGEVPSSYVSGLFDKYADKFEKILQGSLKYSTPQILFAKLQPYLGHDRTIMDIGCGTGLMGERLKPLARKIIGVDLSGKMIDIAAKKHIYDELHVSDFNVFLEQVKESFDTVVAADVLNYIGDLSRTFANVSAVLRQDGVFAFTVEAGPEEGFRLRDTMRFCHSQSYCSQLATDHGFSIALCAGDFLRKERGADVFGHYFVLRKQ
jgi:predicted TPR repeat methyltransferase